MSTFEVVVSARVDAQISERYGRERSASGIPDLYDFESGPLAAARLAFSRFDDVRSTLGPSVRSVTIVDVFFGAVTFTGVLTGERTVEIAEVDIDPDFWDFVDHGPED